MVFYCVDEVERVVFAEVFDAEVIYTEGERSLAGFVAPESWGVFHWFVSVGAEFSNELFECNYAGFLESVHASADFKIDVTVGFDGEVVFVHDFLWDEIASDADVLVVAHGGAEVEVLYIETEVSCAVFCIGDGAVDVDFGVGDCDRG